MEDEKFIGPKICMLDPCPVRKADQIFRENHDEHFPLAG